MKEMFISDLKYLLPLICFLFICFLSKFAYDCLISLVDSFRNEKRRDEK